MGKPREQLWCKVTVVKSGVACLAFAQMQFVTQNSQIRDMTRPVRRVPGNYRKSPPFAEIGLLSTLDRYRENLRHASVAWL